MKKTVAWGWLLAGLLFATGCSQKFDEIRIAPPAPEFVMLIATDRSDFKDRVRNKIIKKYRDFCEIQVVNIRNLKDIKADAYDVVVIMDTCLAWSGFNRSLKSFLDKEQNHRKTVVSMTAGNPDWQFQYKEVDAISSASLPAEQDRFFSAIDAQIQKIIYQ